MAKQKRHGVADQFSDDEMEQIKRYGQGLGGVTPFDEAVERRLQCHEANNAKQRAAESGGSLEDGASEIEQT
jgi:hypothetical protein